MGIFDDPVVKTYYEEAAVKIVDIVKSVPEQYAEPVMLSLLEEIINLHVRRQSKNINALGKLKIGIDLCFVKAMQEHA